MSGVGDQGDHGRLLGDRYRLIERLGAGGMSVVWRGYDEILGRRVAVKVLADRLANDPSFRRRIRLEAQAAARLSHPNITNVYDYGEAVQAGLTVPYVIMELVDGSSLARRLGRDQRLPWREAVTVCAEVAAALAAAHARGVVHRDVTPGNVMLTPGGAKVVDFGISALVGEREAGPDGHLLGTPAYVAPERLDGVQVCAASDVYALGLLLWRALTGTMPWRAETRKEMLLAHLYQDPAPLPPIPGLPDEVMRLCQLCLTKDPAGRPSAAELARTLALAAEVPVALPVVSATRSGSAGQSEVGTTILPWDAETGALAPSETPVGDGRSAGAVTRPSWRHRGPRRSGRGRTAGRPHLREQVMIAAIGVGALAVVGLVWADTSRPSAHGKAAAAATAESGPAPCRVEYALRTDTGRSFDADLTVTNTGSKPLRDWNLAFDFPGDQTISTGRAGQWTQRGQNVIARPGAGQGELAPGDSTVLGLTGAYAGVNRLPVAFRLAGSVCDAGVSGIVGKQSTPTASPPAATAATNTATSSGAGAGGPADVRRPEAPPREREAKQPGPPPGEKPHGAPKKPEPPGEKGKKGK